MITVETLIQNNETILNVKNSVLASMNDRVKGYVTKGVDRDIQRVCKLKLNGYSFDAWDNRSYLTTEQAKTIYDAFDATPVEGLACTKILYSDTYAYTIVKVISPRKIVVRENVYKAKDWYAGDCEVSETLTGREEVFTLRSGGSWIAECQPKKYGSARLSLGYGRTYRDPSF